MSQTEAIQYRKIKTYYSMKYFYKLNIYMSTDVL